METIENSIDLIFEQMLKTGAITTGNLWIEKAIEQRHPRLSVAVANSKFLTYDKLDRKLVELANWN